MRVLRAKAARKALHFYKVTHGIRDPYTLLVDGTFVHHALVGVKTNLASRVEKVLGRDVRYAVPGPVLDDLRNRGEAGAAALEFCRRRCRVIATPRACDTVAKAALHLVGEANSQKFVVATHDRVLQSALRRVPGAPLLYFSGTVLNVDEPSRASRSAAARHERVQGRLTEDEFRVARAIRAQDRVSSNVVAPPPAERSKTRARAEPALVPQAPEGAEPPFRGRRRQEAAQAPAETEGVGCFGVTVLL